MPVEQLLFYTTFRLWQINTCPNATADTIEDGYSWTDEEGQGWVYRDWILEIDTAGSSIASLERCMFKHMCSTSILFEEALNLRTYTFHFARKVIQTMPLLTDPSSKSEPPVAYLHFCVA